jgi:hypothetical protein
LPAHTGYATNEALARFDARGDKLFNVPGQVALQPLAENRFHPATAPTVTLVFAPGPDGVMQMTNGNSVSRRMPPPKTDASTLASLAGDYYSDELDVTWTVVVKDAKAGRAASRDG